MLVLGVDPGIHGAVAISGPAGQLDVFAFPLVTRKVGKKNRNEIDAAALAAMLRDRLGQHAREAYVEHVASKPTDSHVSAFAFGCAYGTVRGVLAALGVPVSLVAPVKWKRVMGLSADKADSVKRATETFPSHAMLFRGPRGGALDGPAEAALLAAYGRQVQQAQMQELLA